PGDGICPTTAQFNLCYQSKLAEWKDAAATRVPGSDSFEFYIQSFLNLLKDVPPFFHSLPDEVLEEVYDYHLIGEICVKSTDDPACDQPQKSLEFRYCVARQWWHICPTVTVTPSRAAIPISARPLRAEYFTSIVLAWSYIFSARWVELLQQAGLECQMFHDQRLQLEDSFWDIILQGRWKAHLERLGENKEALYPLWMLRLPGMSKHQDDLAPVAADSALAFHILLDFCTSEGLEGELLIGLASILFLHSRDGSRAKFPPPAMIPAKSFDSTTTQNNTIFHKLFQNIDQCMFLSSTWDAVDSLLCSAFFDPSVPCNLEGAASLGVLEGLSLGDEIDDVQLLHAITYVKPHLSLFWAAAIYSNRAMMFLNRSLDSLPEISLPAAYWTNTTQSFLQVTYRSAYTAEPIVDRVREFQTFHFCPPELECSGLQWPRSPVPPFGATPFTNLSLEVREHLGHMHRPHSWNICWKLRSGKRFPTNIEHHLKPSRVRTINYYCPVGHVNDPPHPRREIAEKQSWAATQSLFSWQRLCEGAIWLDDGAGDIDKIRRMQIHPWIKSRWNTDGGTPEETEHKELDIDRILQWKDKV
ncbi:uncharacterized protein BO97DRAFT_312849, partial [Aspergillus homomorphus CBS 101889]